MRITDFLDVHRRIYLKSGSHLPNKIRFICFNENPLKMMKNAFYFIWKAPFVLKMFKLLSWLFRYVEKTALLEDKFNLKTYYVTTWLTKSYNYTFPNISRSKGSETLKFGQVKEYNKRNIFLQKSCR